MPRPKPRRTPSRGNRKPERQQSVAQSDDAIEATGARILPFPVVGLGASAGGIEAVGQLLRAIPPDTGMAFVVIQHLDPSHASVLAEIHRRATSMPVIEVRSRMPIEPNRVYVITPGSDLTASRGYLNPARRTEARGQHRPIDTFLRSLAEGQGHQAIGVILSGTATDGTLGVEEIKAAGGITFAQDETAQQNSMPRSAAASGCVDFVLPPQGIAAELARVARHPYVAPAPADAPPVLPPFNLAPALELLHDATGVDFAHYKRHTLQRRIARRILLHKLEATEDYIELLKKNPAEVQALYQDVLINVTSFFRNPESYEMLQRTVFPELIAGHSRQNPVRMWVLGCSTGEEAYSLAIAYSEFMETTNHGVPLQIFASDLNGDGVEKARSGIYSRAIAQDVSRDRLERYFVETEGGYRVLKSIRDACIFARHNLLTEPPFSRLDFISCRNLLIYLGQEAQQRVIPMLHYALLPKGFLWLGTSESIGIHRGLFDMKEPTHKIYRKKGGAPRSAAHGLPVLNDFRPEQRKERMGAAHFREAVLPGAEVQKEADRILLARYAPAGVLVNSDFDILQFKGDTGPYLAPAPGRASLNLLKMLREGLPVALRTALHTAQKQNSAVRKERLRVKSNGGYGEIDVEVIPVTSGPAGERCFLVLFELAGDGARTAARVKAGRRRARGQETAHTAGEINRLKQELAATRDYLQSVIEQQEAANEELQSANEEIQSGNEELQSINEELETSKEEIQSSNEELVTVNEELGHRNEELAQSNSDLVNLLASVQLAIVMLGPGLRIRRFTPAAENMLNLIPADVGRSIIDLNIKFAIPDFARQLEEVIATGTVREFELQDQHGKWHSVRLQPYRTLDNKVNGVVIVLVEIDTLKRGRDLLQRQADLLDQVNQAILMWELGGNIIYWNKAAESLYGFTHGEALLSPREQLLSAAPFGEIEQMLKREGQWSGEIVLTREDGRRIALESQMVLGRIVDGRHVVIEANRPVAGAGGDRSQRKGG